MRDSESNSRVSESEPGKNGNFCTENYGKRAGENVVSASKCLAVKGTSQVEFDQASPDSLKNTPSNIARLEDMIEQCKGRRKYLAQTKSSSDGEDVRWYFCKVPLLENQQAASVPQTEIVGKSEYFRFSLRDSLALEASFLQREEELLSCWWEEYAECSEGPDGPSISSVDSSGSASKPYSSEGDQSSQSYAIEEERVGVPVKGGLYEVDLIKRHCFPVYWSGENRRVLRGHWFARKARLEWLPLRENVAEQLEFAYRGQVWHRRTFQPSGLFAARIDLQGTTQGLHALFTGEDDTWEAWLGVDNSGFSHVTGRGHGIQLRRGFSSAGSLEKTQDELRQQKEEEMDDYCSQVPVRHLIFMVHGIGQRLEKANLVDDVATFRHITASLAEWHLTSYQRGTQRVLFIPCQWRRSLKLGSESTVENITLDGVRGLRVMLSATVHDVLYYMSPIYCQDIIDSVSNQLNRLYMKFIRRNPGYDGKVSIYGHSLGSVLSFDILCHQESLSSIFPMDSLRNVGKGDSLVPAANQSAALSSAVISGSASDARNADTSEEPVESVKERHNSSSQLDAVNNTGVPSVVMDPSPMSLLEAGSLKSGDCPNQVESSCSSVQQTVDFKQCSKMLLLEEDSPELELGFGDLFSPQGDGLDAEVNKSTWDLHGAVDKMAGDVSDVGDRDKLTSLLREEVESLKARIAELELNQGNSLISCNSGEHRGEECHQGVKVDKTMSNQSTLGKVSLDQDDSRKSYTPYIKYTKLNFKVDTFFAVGSPLGVFLALRNIRIGIGEGQDYWQDERMSEAMPACRRMFNIFHPFDPVAYRVEPLISKEYIIKRPVIIPYRKGGKRLHIGFQEFIEDLATHSQALISRLNSMRVQMVNMFQPRNKDEKEEDAKETETRTYGSIMMERLTGSEDGRIDHMLQDATFELAYISAIGSHTSYWRDYDTALFILKHLYCDIAEEPSSTEHPNYEGELKNQRSRGHRSYRTQAMDEEDLPLTFSDSVLIKEFSRKANKAMKTG